MKISTRLGIAIFIPALMALFIIIALGFSYIEMGNIQQDGAYVRQIRSSITELNHLVFSYVLYHEERPKQQFIEEHKVLTGLISATQLQNPEQQALLANISQDNEGIADTFSQLVSNYDRSSASSTNEFKAAEDRLVALLLLRSYQADSDAAALRSMVDAGIKTTEIRTTGLILAVIILAALSVTYVLMLTKLRITTSLSNLSKGAAIIGSGNLDYTIPEDSRDEIGEVAGAFNRMTSNLSQVTASRVELEQEIDKRKKAEQETRSEWQRLVKIMGVMEDGVCIMTPSMGIEYVNPSLEKIYGPVEGQNCHRYFYGLDEKCLWCNNNEVLDGKTIKLETQTKNGRIFEITHSPFTSQDGRIFKLAIFHDITERKKMEQLKDEFISMVSHELKTPLTVIIGAINTAMVDGISEEDARSLMQDASSSSEALAAILENLLELSRFQANRFHLNIEAIDLRKAISDVVTQLSKATSDHTFFVNVLEDISPIRADRIRVTRIVYNLAENAIKYSPNGGEIKIQAREDGDSVVVSVTDNGVGISPGDQLRLFRQFERLDTVSRQGLGLGLLVCRRLVEAHKGRIWVESEPGKGSTFYFTLPRTPEE